MKKLIATAAIAAILIPAAGFAASKPAPKAKTYVCSTCHMKFTAAKAKADHYKDPMDGGKLVPAAPATKMKTAPKSSGSMGGMKM